MRRAPRVRPPSGIPTFGLYGTDPLAGWTDLVHAEDVSARAPRHGWEIRPHVHDSLLQVLHLTAGRCDALIDGAAVTVSPGTAILVPVGVVHAFTFAPDSEGAVVTAAQRPIESAASAIAPGLARLIARPQVVPIDPNGRHAAGFDATLAAIRRESVVHAAGEAGSGIALVIALLVELQRIAGVGGPAARGARGQAAVRIDRFRALLDAHCRERWPVERYAAALAMSPTHLRRLCRSVLGMSAIDAINARVIHESRRELVYSSLPIKQVAATLGFDDDAYFGRFFKKHTGLRPTEFRERALAALAERSSG